MEPPATVAPKSRGDVIDIKATALQGEAASRLGRHARRPTDIPWSGWKRVILRTVREVITDRMSLCAAGCAFYATLALFPAISMLVSLYGLAFDPRTVGPQLEVLRNLLPENAYQLIADRVQMLVSKPSGTLTFSLALSFVIALWSASTGTKSILGALNLAYEEREARGFLRFQLTALGMTLGGILAAVLGLASLVGFCRCWSAFSASPPMPPSSRAPPASAFWSVSCCWRCHCFTASGRHDGPPVGTG